jgi:hypothetical protein
MSVICSSADGSPPGKSISGLWMSMAAPFLVASARAYAARLAARPFASKKPRRLTPPGSAEDLEILFDKC